MGSIARQLVHLEKLQCIKKNATVPFYNGYITGKINKIVIKMVYFEYLNEENGFGC